MAKEITVRSFRNTMIPVSIYEADGNKGTVFFAHSFKEDRFEDDRYVKLSNRLNNDGISCIIKLLKKCPQQNRKEELQHILANGAFRNHDISSVHCKHTIFASGLWQ